MPKNLPLKGLRVANFGWGWLGPVSGQTLAFLGAEVYKIESHARVDINRMLPPYGEGIQGHDRSLQNHAGWAGNGSITINLKNEDGQALAREFVSKCDIVIENFGPGVMDKLNLGYENMREAKPDIIMASMPAAGVTGPMSSIRTYGMSLSSITGLDSLTGYIDGKPVPMENAYADPLGGIIGAFSVLLAVAYRNRTGKGQLVDFSQQEGIAQMVGPAFMDYVLNDRIAGPIENRHPGAAGAPHGVFPCTGDDRWISLVVLTEDEWKGFVAAMGDPGWAKDAAYATAAKRVENIEALHAKVIEWTSGFEQTELANKLQEHGVAAAPVLGIADLIGNPQHKARKTFVEVTHPLGFKETIYGAYVKTSRTEANIRPGPMMGCDNDHVFKSILEFSDERYAQLQKDEVIF